MLNPLAHPFSKIASLRGAFTGSAAQDSRRGFWAMADQGLVSLGNFVLNVVLARHFAQHHQLREYGAFWVFMELMIFLNGIQAALLIYPISIRGAIADRRGLARMVGHSLLLTLLCAPVLLLAQSIVALMLQLPMMIGLWSAAALLFWQLQETTRRGLMAHLRFRAAAIGDAVSYIGQTLCVVWLALNGSLTLQGAFEALAMTSALAWMIQLLQLRIRPSDFRAAPEFDRECWQLGRWILYGNFTNLCSGVLFNWNFAYWAGKEILGVYYGLINVVRLVNPLSFAIATLITPSAARERKSGGMVGAKRIALRYALLGGLVAIPYLATVIIFPTLSIHVFYGSNSTYLRYADLLPLCAISLALIYIATAAGAFLNSVEHAREAFWGQIIYAAGYLLLVMPLTALYGIDGAIYAWVAVAAARAVANVHFSERLDQNDDDRAPLAHPGSDIGIAALNAGTGGLARRREATVAVSRPVSARSHPDHPDLIRCMNTRQM